MKQQIMAKLFDRMALVVKASVDTGQDGEQFAAYRVRQFGVMLIATCMAALMKEGLGWAFAHPLPCGLTIQW